MDKLFIIPVSYKYGGGWSALVRANSLEDARKIAKKYRNDFSADSINDELELGDIDKFKSALIGYWE